MEDKYTDKELEEWRDVVGYEGLYEVSNVGRVRRHLASKRKTSTYSGRVLIPSVTTTGYLRIELRNGQKKKHAVHRLVCEAFVGPPPFCGATVNHRDLIKMNNTPCNLEWLSSGDNTRHAISAGKGCGELNGLSKWTNEQVSYVKDLLMKGICVRCISSITEVSLGSVWDIKNDRVRVG